MNGKPVNATAGMTMALTGATVFAASLLYVAIAGVPGGTTAGSSPSQQQTSGAPQGGPQSAPGGTRETTGYGAPTGARPPRE